MSYTGLTPHTFHAVQQTSAHLLGARQCVDKLACSMVLLSRIINFQKMQRQYNMVNSLTSVNRISVSLMIHKPSGRTFCMDLESAAWKCQTCKGFPIKSHHWDSMIMRV